MEKVVYYRRTEPGTLPQIWAWYPRLGYAEWFYEDGEYSSRSMLSLETVRVRGYVLISRAPWEFPELNVAEGL
jgi:hypothetical protein